MTALTRVLRAPKNAHRRPIHRRRAGRRGIALAAVAVTTAGLLAGAAFTAPAASATTPNPTPSAGARPGATRLPFSISGTTSLSVDVATGNALITDQLLTLPGRVNDTPISLSYNSSVAGSSVPSAVTGSNGTGWGITGFDERLVTNADSSITFYGPGGLSGVFTPNGSGFNSPSQFKATLATAGSGWTLTYHSSQEKLTFNSLGRLTTDTDRNGNTTTYSFDSLANPLSIVSSRGPAAGRTITITTTNHRITALTQTTPNLSRTVQLTYTAGGNLQSVIDPDGAYTTFYGPGGTDVPQIATVEFRGIDSRLGFDASNRVTSVAQDNPTTDGGQGTQTTRLAYPSSTQTLVADPITNQSQSVSAVPHTTYTINSANLVSSAQDQDGNTRSATYNPFGDTASTTNASAGGVTAYNYSSTVNSGESLTGITNPGGATESAAYTNSGNTAYLPSSTTDDAGSKLTYSYDANGNQSGTAQGASGPSAKVTYNSDGTPATSASPGAAAGVVTTYAHANGDGNLTSITPPTGTSLGVRTYTWDDFGRLSTATDGRGNTTTYSYDPMDRITNVAYSDGTHTVGYSYNDAGQVTQRTDANGTTTYTYDDLGHLLTVKNTANGNQISYTYDLDGQLSTSTDGLGTTTYSYDNAHQLTRMTYPQGGSTLYAYFANNGDGKRTDVWLQGSSLDGNGHPTVWAAHENFGYDSTGRITRVIGQNGPATGPTTVENETICYTAGTTPGSSCPAATGTGVNSTDRSNIQWTSETVSGESNAYTYDDHNRLTKDVVTGGSNPRTYTYGYDNAGNRTSSSVTGTSSASQTLTFNNGNQISSTGYTYDGSGNLTTSPTRTATFNAAGQQKTSTTGGVTSSYTYAGTNINEVLSETIPNDHTYTLTYGRPDKNGLPTVDSVNVAGLGTGYVLSDPSGQPVLLSVSTGVTLLYLYDGIHNPIGLSTSFQTTAAAFKYDPYGGDLSTTNPNFSTSYENPYTFGEGLLDRATHEIKFGQRFYSAATGTWTQQDKLNAPLDPANANRYEYAADNPVNITDATGARGNVGDLVASGVLLEGEGQVAEASAEAFATGAIGAGPLGIVAGAFAIGTAFAVGSLLDDFFD